MAMTKLGGGITEINGKMSGNIFRHDQCGQHIQSWPRQVALKNPTEEQLLQRACFRDCVWVWGNDVTDQQVLRWYHYAAMHWKTNKKGEPIQLSGWNAFLSINLPRARNGVVLLRDPPAN